MAKLNYLYELLFLLIIFRMESIDAPDMSRWFRKMNGLQRILFEALVSFALVGALFLTINGGYYFLYNFKPAVLIINVFIFILMMNQATFRWCKYGITIESMSRTVTKGMFLGVLMCGVMNLM